MGWGIAGKIVLMTEVVVLPLFVFTAATALCRDGWPILAYTGVLAYGFFLGTIYGERIFQAFEKIKRRLQ